MGGGPLSRNNKDRRPVGKSGPAPPLVLIGYPIRGSAVMPIRGREIGAGPFFLNLWHRFDLIFFIAFCVPTVFIYSISSVTEVQIRRYGNCRTAARYSLVSALVSL